MKSFIRSLPAMFKSKSWCILIVCIFCLNAMRSFAGVEGRIVRIEMPVGGQYMNFTEIEVFSGSENVTSNGVVTSRTRAGDALSVAIDGDKTKYIDTRPFEQEYWLEVDLNQTNNIDKIVITQRPKYSSFDGVLMTILDGDRRVVWYKRAIFNPNKYLTELTVTPFEGRYNGTVIPVGTTKWYNVDLEGPGDYHIVTPLKQLTIVPSPDAEQRMEKFNDRDSDAEVAKLCKRFAAALDPDAPGLETFRGLCARGDYRGALDAYRDCFFAKEMESVDIPVFNNYSANALLQNRRVQIIPGSTIEGEIGAPGATAWIPYDVTLPTNVFVARGGMGALPSHVGREEAARIYAQISFFTESEGPTFSNFNDLLLYYGASGNTTALTKWMDYLDDWCLFGLDDIHASPLGLIWATEGGCWKAFGRLQLIHSLAKVRPEFATQIRSTTLARYVLAMIESLPAYTIRAKRTQLANWGVIALVGPLKMHKALPEFIAVQAYRNEAWRLWQDEWIHRNCPDGTGAEATDGPYRFMALAFVPFDYERPWTGALDEMQWREILDHSRDILRQALGEAPQTGFGFMHRDNLAWRARNDPFFDEAETRARLAIFEGTTGTHAPSVLSEMTAYGGKSILRENWAPNGEFFYMNNFRFGSQDPQLRTSYYLLHGDEAKAMGGIYYENSPLFGYPILVDRRGPHPKHGITPGVGGKTEFLDRASSEVVDTRFHTSDRFDVAEAKQDAPYALRNVWAHYWVPHSPQNSFVKGPHATALAKIDDSVVTDVVTWRQVFSIRGDNLYIVSDRIESANEHEYASCFYLNLPGAVSTIDDLQAHGTTLIHTDPDALQVSTTVPDQRNLSVRFFASIPLELFNKFDASGNYQTSETAGKAYPVGVHGQGSGKQLLIAVHNTLPVAGANAPSADLQNVSKLDGAAGVTGFSAKTRNGTKVWYQAGPQLANALEAGPVSATAESLLVVEKNGELSGVALGCTALTLDGQPIAIPHPDLEFVLKPDTRNLKPLFTPIHRPIDTVRILPSQNVFTDSVQVSFRIPTQDTDGIEFRYTLDGSDPSIESALYAKPFTLTETTLVKVRAFREGLKTTPYRQCGTDSSSIFHALFTKETPRPALTTGVDTGNRAGLDYLYYESNIWPQLFAHAGVEGVLDVKARGTVRNLLDTGEVSSIRQTDGPYAIVYRGLISIPVSGIYTFYAPQHLYDVTADAGFDLRVFVDGEEWTPSPRLHAENTWSVPLESGKHTFEVRFVDFRHKTWRNEWWMAGHKEVVWQGIPVLEVSGPKIEKQPIPSEWLRREHK